VLELVEGKTLEQQLGAGPISVDESLRISAQVAGALEIGLEDDDNAELGTDDQAAFQAYMPGREAFSRRTAASLRIAETEFQQALDLDPDFARAHVGLADT